MTDIHRSGAEQTAEATALLQALVRAPSPNPPGEERAAAEVVRAYLEDTPGVVIEDVGVAAERPMIVATLHGAVGGGRTLLLGGHIDTVPVADGWTKDPFGGEIADGRLYGLGASDMKGGVAGLLVAMRELSGLRDRWAGTIVAHVVPDEEPGGHLGAELLLERGLITGDAAIIAEPSELSVYRAQKGNLFVKARFEGRSAHGSTPDLGVSAISRAVRVAVDLEDRLGPILGGRHHELVGPATLNVGTISGGRRTNMVPDQCVLTVDRRLLPFENIDDAKAELESFLDGCAEVTYEHVGAPFELPADNWLVRVASEVIDEAHGCHVPVGGLVGSSDARFYAAAGVPTIIVGPGSPSQAHTPDEYVDVAALGASVGLYRDIALRVLAPERRAA